MSSDDNYYELPDRQYDSSRHARPRRRSPLHPRNRKNRKDEYFCYKSRRTKAWYTRHSSRIMAAFMLAFIAGYEFLILKGPLTDEDISDVRAVLTARTSTTKSRDSKEYEGSISNPDEDHPSLSSLPPSSAAGSVIAEPLQPNALVSRISKVSTADKISATLHDTAREHDKKPSESYRPPRNFLATAAADSSVPSRERDVATSILRRHLDTKAADADDDVSESSNAKAVEETDSIKPYVKSWNKSSVAGDVDIEPPKPRAKAVVRDRGADPGAGENFWQWFQDNKGNEKSAVGDSLSCPDEYKRLCQMFYKYLRKYKIRCVFDTSCGTNLDWLVGVLEKAGSELWGFKYYCGVASEEEALPVKEKLGSMKFVEIVADEWWRVGFPDDTELLFGWDILPHIPYGRIWNFFVKAKKQNLKYILIDNYPGILNDPSPKRNYLNVRKHPFRFPAAKEVVQNVTEPGETAKRQLLFYESHMLPDNLQ